MSQRFLASCLRVEIDDATKQWLESRPAMSAACEKLEAMIDDVIRRYGASRSERLERGAILAFIDPLASIEAAAALMFMVSKEFWPTRKPLKIKLAVRTGMIESRRNGVGGQIVDLCEYQLDRTFSGQATICETTRNLLHRELPPDISIEDFGRVQIDADRPAERLFALRISGVSNEDGPITANLGANHNIPVRLTSFVGREDELESLERMVREHRFLTIVGPGGTGKTSLSRELARRFALELPDGAWFVPLVDITDEAGIYRAVGESMKEVVAMSSVSGEGILHEIGDRSLLLVLDNLEQLLRPATRFIHKLLTFCPYVKVLATSRHATGAAGEQSHPMLPFGLSDVDENSDLAKLVQNPAIRLFIDRARAVDPSFGLTNGNSATVLSICRHVEGLPLAIEHAASNVTKLSLIQIERTLETSLLTFRVPADTLEARHATMRATVQWSLDLLSNQARLLASALLPFAGGWTLESCIAIAVEGAGMGHGDAIDAHGELVDASIAIRFESSDEPRFRFSEAFKEALSEIKPPDDRILRAHAHYFDRFARCSESELLGINQSDWIRRLEAEAQNLRVAVRYVWEHEIESAPEFVSSMRRFWLRSRQHQEAIHWFENALSVTAPERAELRATLLNALGACHFRIGEPAIAERYYSEGRAIWERLGSPSDLAAVLTNLAMCKVERNDFAEALELSRESCRQYEFAHDLRGLGSALMNLGYFQAQMGDLVGADESLKRSSELLESSAHSSHLCLALANRSYVAWKRGNASEYHELVRRQIELIERSHDATSLGAVALGIAACATEKGRIESARSALTLLHEVMGPKPQFSHRLHQQQYDAALVFAGPFAPLRVRWESRTLEWDTVIESLSVINADFSTSDPLNAS